MFWHHIFQETEVEFWHVWEVLAVGGYFMPVSLNEFWWAAMVQASLTVLTSLCSSPVFMSDPQQPTGEALSTVRAESLSVWSTSNIFEQFRQGWVQVIQSLPNKCLGKMRRTAWFFSAFSGFRGCYIYSKTTHQHEPLMWLTSSIYKTHLKLSYLPQSHLYLSSASFTWGNNLFHPVEASM